MQRRKSSRSTTSGRQATAARFPEIHTFSVEEKLGPWAELQKTHFADGGIYDQITVKQN
jgi:ABC-type sulfate transport system substrate-binding protein